MSAPVWVILPTYDEAATLEPVVLGVLAAVPEAHVVFRGREHGRSKMSARIALEAAWLVPALRFARWMPNT